MFQGNRGVNREGSPWNLWRAEQNRTSRATLQRTLASIITGLVLVVMTPSCMTAVERKVAGERRWLTATELDDLLVGASIQATRGTDLRWMRSEIRAALRDGARIELVPVDRVPDHWLTVSLAGVGGGGAWTHVTERIERQNLPERPDFLFMAAEALSEYLGRKFDAVVRAEAGEATVYAVLAAARMGVPVVDACLSGRARPELQQQVPTLEGIPSTPAVLVSRWGDVVIIRHTADENRTEDLARAISVASGGGVAMAMTPLSGSDLRRGVIPGSLSEAIRYGETIRKAVESGENPVTALVRLSGARKLFQGVVAKSVVEGKDGFSVGWLTLSGTGPYLGEHYYIYVKNEQIAGWRNGNLDILPPDSIWVLDPDTALPSRGASLGALPEEKEVVVLGMTAPDVWKSGPGREVMGPAHFGLNGLQPPD